MFSLLNSELTEVKRGGIKLIDCLLKLNINHNLVHQGAQLSQDSMCSLAKLFEDNSFACALINKVVTLRTKLAQRNEKESQDKFEISRNLLNIVRTHSIS